MMDSKELFERLKRELDKRALLKEQEERGYEGEEDMSMNDESSTSSVEASSPYINRHQRQSSAARKKKPHRGRSRKSHKIIDSPHLHRSLSSSLYSSMQLPTACLNEHDGCDEAELVARANRCKEILRLSKEAKEAAEAAKNKRPLIWAKATFELTCII